METLQNWQARAFVVHIGGKASLVRDVISPVMPPGFLKVASQLDCIKAAYHCLPRQLFKNVQVDHALISRVQLEDRPAKIKIEPTAKLVLDYLKDRLVATSVLSMPRSWLLGAEVAPPEGALGLADVGPDDRALVPALAGGAPSDYVKDALALVSAPPAGGYEVRMGEDFQHHTFPGVERRAQQASCAA